MSGEKAEDREQGERPDWLGPPGEHGGEYRPDKKRGDTFVPEAGCCLIEAVASFAVLLGVGLSVYNILP